MEEMLVVLSVAAPHNSHVCVSPAQSTSEYATSSLGSTPLSVSFQSTVHFSIGSLSLQLSEILPQHRCACSHVWSCTHCHVHQRIDDIPVLRAILRRFARHSMFRNPWPMDVLATFQFSSPAFTTSFTQVLNSIRFSL